VVDLVRLRSTEESLELWGQVDGESPRFNYRWEHLQAVWRLCQRMGSQLDADLEVLEAAVWLHDIVKSHAVEQEPIPDAEKAAEEARQILKGTDFPPSKIDAVAGAIRVHEGLYKDQPLKQLEAAILWDADKLSKLGATYLVHNLCIRPAFDPIFQGRPTDTRMVIDSLEKWLQIGQRIVDSMNTEPGREEGTRRLAYLREFLVELKGEW